MPNIPLAGEKYGCAKQRRIVHFAVTLEQYEIIEDDAMLVNMTVSEYIRFKLGLTKGERQ